MSRKLIPLFDRVLVEKLVPANLKTPGGVLLPENLKKVTHIAVLTGYL